ncbi:hypothetical protein LCD33_24790, partial [Saccharopolyspora sp. 7B]|nr:hypothetical protein [Saccharopolyspora sp. 7B]
MSAEQLGAVVAGSVLLAGVLALVLPLRGGRGEHGGAGPGAVTVDRLRVRSRGAPVASAGRRRVPAAGPAARPGSPVRAVAPGRRVTDLRSADRPAPVGRPTWTVRAGVAPPRPAAGAAAPASVRPRPRFPANRVVAVEPTPPRPAPPKPGPPKPGPPTPGAPKPGPPKLGRPKPGPPPKRDSPKPGSFEPGPAEPGPATSGPPERGPR